MQLPRWMYSADEKTVSARVMCILIAIALGFFLVSYFVSPLTWNKRYSLADWRFEAMRTLLASCVAFAWSQFFFRKETGWLLRARGVIFRRQPEPKLFVWFCEIRKIFYVSVLVIGLLTVVFNQFVMPIEFVAEATRDGSSVDSTTVRLMYLAYLPVVFVMYALFFPLVFFSSILGVIEPISVAARMKEKISSVIDIQTRIDNAKIARLIKICRVGRMNMQRYCNQYITYISLWSLLTLFVVTSGDKTLLDIARYWFWLAQSLMAIPVVVFVYLFAKYGMQLQRAVQYLESRYKFKAAKVVHTDCRPSGVLLRSIDYNFVSFITVIIIPLAVELYTK